jgi:hypothetical protein
MFVITGRIKIIKILKVILAPAPYDPEEKTSGHKALIDIYPSTFLQTLVGKLLIHCAG